MADQGNQRASKDKEMAARLKKDPQLCERFTGRCVICRAIIRNGVSTYNHYLAHSRGAEGA